MISLLVAGAVLVSAIWVYWDATSNKVGKTAEGKGFFNMSAGAWSAATLLFWLIVFPAYLIKRGDLIEIAKDHPVIANGRSGKISALIVLGSGFLVLTVGLPSSGSLPSCTSKHATGLVGQIVGDMPVIKLTGAKFVSLNNPSELGYNKDSDIRLCTGVLITTLGEDELQYSVQWISKSKGTFSVNAQIVGL